MSRFLFFDAYFFLIQLVVLFAGNKHYILYTGILFAVVASIKK